MAWAGVSGNWTGTIQAGLVLLGLHFFLGHGLFIPALPLSIVTYGLAYWLVANLAESVLSTASYEVKDRQGQILVSDGRQVVEYLRTQEPSAFRSFRTLGRDLDLFFRSFLKPAYQKRITATRSQILTAQAA